MSENYDDMLRSGQRQLERINAQMAEQNANFARARVEGDQDGMDYALQEWSNLENAATNLQNNYARQIAAAQAAQPRVPTLEERRARPFSAMDWNDVVDMTRQSKYARNIRADDPWMVAGYYEAQRRRSRGE